MIVLQNGLTIVGIGLLFVALRPLRQLMNQLPSGSLKSSWYLLTALIVCFIVGYGSYGLARFDSQGGPIDLIVPAIFFLGGYFVFLVTLLSSRTASDARRLALLERENIVDPLMGIYNRRYMERRLKEEIMRAQRFGLPLSVLLLDIDNFKEINDTYGHRMGDHVLACVGKSLTRTVRAIDIVARYGGDEVLVISPNTSLASATHLAERLRRVIGESLGPSGECAMGTSMHPTASVGVAVLTSSYADGHDLLSSVDDALYRAKREGRNRVAARQCERLRA